MHTAPLLLYPTDVLRLASGVTLTSSGLHDISSGRDHDLNETALQMVALLDGEHSVDDVAQMLVTRYGLEPEAARSETLALLAQLERFELVDRAGRRRGARRPVGSDRPALTAGSGFAGRSTSPTKTSEPAPRPTRRPSLLLVAAWVRAVATFGAARPSRRYRATYGNVGRAVAHAYRYAYVAVFVAGLAVVFLAVSRGWDASAAMTASDWTAVLSVPFSMVLTLWLTMAAHEWGHLFALRQVGAEAHYVVARGMVVGIRFSGVQGWRSRVVGASGPVTAAVTGVGLAYSFGVTGALEVVWLYALVLGLAHLVALLPWHADGRAVWLASRAALRGRRPTGDVLGSVGG